MIAQTADEARWHVIRALVLATTLTTLALVLYSCGDTRPAYATGSSVTDNENVHRPTYPKIVNDWFVSLHNYEGGSCCGLGDAYPAEILEDATEGVENSGTVRITDPRGRMIWIDEHYGIEIPPITQANLTFKFSHSKTTPELQGNPLGHAIVFVSVDTEGHVVTVYCVVPLPPSF